MYKLKLRDKLRRAWLFVICAGALTALQACGGSSSEKTVETQAQGFVSTSAPMANMTVNFYAAANKSGPQVEGSPIATGTSNVNGLFLSSVFLPSQVLDSNNWPAAPVNFRVTASGGTMNGSPVMGVLRADVRNYQSGQAVYVNAVTTLVAAYLDATPGITLADAETAVGKFLGLSGAAWGSAYVPYDSVSFSQLKFDNKVATQLTSNGSQTNINTYIAGLLVEMKANPTATHSFTGTPTTVNLVNPGMPASGCSSAVAKLSVASKVNASACGVLTPATTTLISKIVGEGFSNLVPGPGGKLLGAGFDFAFSLLGLNNPDKPGDPYASRFADLQNTINQVKTQIFELKGQVDELKKTVLKGTYQTIVSNNSLLINDIENNLDNIKALANLTTEGYNKSDDSRAYWNTKKETSRASLKALATSSARLQLHRAMIGDIPGSDSIIGLTSTILTTNKSFYNSQMDKDYATIINYWQAAQVGLFGLVLAELNLEGAPKEVIAEYINLVVGNATAAGSYDKTLPPAAGSQLGIQNAMIPSRLPQGTVYSINSKLLISDSSESGNAYKYLYITPGAGTQAGEVSNLFDQNNKLADPWRLPTPGEPNTEPKTELAALRGGVWRLPTPDEATAIFKGWSGASPAEWAIAQGWPKMNVFLYKSTPQVQPYTALVPTSAFVMATTETLKQLNSHVNFVSGRSFNMGRGITEEKPTQFDTTSSWVEMEVAWYLGFTHETSSTDMGKWNNRFRYRPGQVNESDQRVALLRIGADPVNEAPGHCSLLQGWWARYNGDWQTRETPCEVVTEYNHGYGSNIVNLIPVRTPAAGEFYVPR
jgi:hypothetical protein